MFEKFRRNWIEITSIACFVLGVLQIPLAMMIEAVFQPMEWVYRSTDGYPVRAMVMLEPSIPGLLGLAVSFTMIVALRRRRRPASLYPGFVMCLFSLVVTKILSMTL